MPGPNPNPNPTPPTPPTLDIEVLNNGVKLVGEAIVPGAALLMEKNVGSGLAFTALGELGGMAAGSVFGPLGYILARYGASAASFAQSIQPPPQNGPTAKAVQENTAVVREFLARVAPPPQQHAAADLAAAFENFTKQLKEHSVQLQELKVVVEKKSR